jgi:omega-amidase
MPEPTEHLAVALLQANLYWENPTANLAMLEEQLAMLPAPADLVVLPEMFSTGFSMNAAKVAEAMDLTTTRWMKQMAAKTGAMMIGSFAVREGGRYFNRLLCVRPDGTYEAYDKRHLFRMGQEHDTYTAGTQRLVVEWKGWRICPLVCYDLRFPVWSRNSQTESYDLLLYVANWPARRAYAWQTLLRARAIENLCYVVGVNRVGADGQGIDHTGGSQVLDFLGEPITELGAAEAATVVTISHAPLLTYRQKFPAHLDADPFKLTTD